MISGGFAAVAPGRCIACGQCQFVCPRQAVVWRGAHPLPAERGRPTQYESLLDLMRARLPGRRFLDRPLTNAITNRIVGGAGIDPENVYGLTILPVTHPTLRANLERLCDEGVLRAAAHATLSPVKAWLARFRPPPLASSRAHPGAFHGAPLVLLTVARLHVPHADAACRHAVRNMAAVCRAMGLGWLVSGGAQELLARHREARRLLELDRFQSVAGVLLAGYPAPVGQSVPHARVAPGKHLAPT
jgi:ferredoxin